MWLTGKRLENKLLRHGTMVGPVTREMITLAKAKYTKGCHLARTDEEPDMWFDFLGQARAELKKKTD